MTDCIGPLVIAEMTQEEAEVVAGWHYEPPYDFYDANADHRDPEELIDPKLRGGGYFTARSEAGEVVCYFGFRLDGEVLGVGIGLRPDLTGRGLGLSVLEDGLAFARARFRPQRFRLSVAEFNRRAITVYERAGFATTRSFARDTNGRRLRFVEMERDA